MPVPSPRNKILPVRGNIASLNAALADLFEGEICYAFDEDQYYQKEGGVLVPVGATKAQGLLADSAIQPGDNVSELTNDAAYVDATGAAAAAPVQSVAGKTGAVTLVKGDVGLENVDNTSDLNKPISTATQTVLDAKAPLASPALTGSPTAPTATPGTSTTQLATTAFVGAAVSAAAVPVASETVQGKVELATAAETTAGTDDTRAVHPAGLKVELDKKAPLASPALTGTPTAPTATGGTSTTQIATTAFVNNAVAGITYPVQSVAGKTGVVTLVKADVDLGNVDNTSDLNKPISTATQSALSLKADLVGGVIPNSQLPSLAISEYLGSVNSQAAMLALTGQRGDWCIRTDTGSTWVITTDGGSLLSHWTQLATPADAVTSVNGYTGTVVLGKADVGLGNADNTSDLNKPVSTATQTALGLKANLASPALTGTPTAPTATAGTNTAQIATTAFVTDAVNTADEWTRTGTTLAPKTAGDVVAVSAGTAALPGLSIVADADTGISSSAANTLDISAGGTGRVRVNSTVQTLNEIYGSTYYPVVTQVDVGTGFNQIPLNSYLGTMAFQDASAFTGSIGLGSAAYPSLSVTGDENTGLYSPGADQLAISTGGTGRIHVSSTGTVNIVGAGTPGSTQAVSFNGSAPVNSLVVDSSGNLLVGTSTARTNFYNGANTAQIQLEGTNYQNAAFAIVCNANNDDKGSLILAKNRGATIGSNTIVQNGDDLGSIEFQGSDGTEFVQAANIKTEVDGTPGANSMPGRIVLSTTAAGASSPIERLRIATNGLHTINSQAHSGAALSTTAPAKLYLSTGTYTDTSTAASGTVTHGTIAAFDNPAIAATNATVTYTNASTVYIDGAPTGGTNVTVTNGFALYVNAGNTHFGGSALSASATGGVGYKTGAGGTVTQATSRTTGVTINKICGAITLVSAAGSTFYQSFTVTNSTVAATDTIIVNQKSGTDLYLTFVTAVAAGSFRITFATTGGTTTEQPVFNFTVLKGVTA